MSGRLRRAGVRRRLENLLEWRGQGEWEEWLRTAQAYAAYEASVDNAFVTKASGAEVNVDLRG